MDKYTLGEVAYKNGYEKGFQDGIKHEKQVRENNNYAYQAKMSKKDIDKVPVFGKEKLKECKDYLKKMGIVDTNSKEYIETQAYNKFAERLKRISEFSLDKDAFVVTDQEIDNIRDELIKEVEDNDRK